MLGPFRVEFILNPRRARLLNAPKLFRIAVAGTSFRQPALRGVARDRHNADGGVAELTYEVDNLYDHNAVMVSMLGAHIGYLPRGLCVEYREALRSAIPAGAAITPLLCPA